MHNWRATIGFMLPSSCLVYEQEFIAITQTLKGVIGVPARLLINQCDSKGLSEMNDQIEMATQQLITCDPDILVYMCTSGSFMDGNSGEEALRRRIQELTPKPVITTSQAVMHAIKTLNLRKLVMLTPYNDDLTQREIDWLKRGDVGVIDHHFRDIPDNLDRGAQYPEESFECVRKMNWQEADGILLSCANVRSLEIIEELEKHTGKPVVTSSIATTWMALRECGIKDAVQNYGSLLKI